MLARLVLSVGVLTGPHELLEELLRNLPRVFGVPGSLPGLAGEFLRSLLCCNAVTMLCNLRPVIVSEKAVNLSDSVIESSNERSHQSCLWEVRPELSVFYGKLTLAAASVNFHRKRTIPPGFVHFPWKIDNCRISMPSTYEQGARDRKHVRLGNGVMNM